MPLDTAPTINPILSQTAMEFYGGFNEYIAARVAPNFQTGLQSAKYYKDSIENIVSTPGQGLERAPGTAYGRISMKLSSDTYNTTDRGIEVPVDDSERAKYAEAWNADNAAIRKGVHTILADREIRLAALATGSGVTAESMTALDGANGDVFLAEVFAEIEEIRKATGIKPNTLIINPAEWQDHLMLDTELLARIKNNGNGQLSEVTASALANILKLDQIIIPGAIKATSKDGQTVTTGDIWPAGEAYLCYVTSAAGDLSAPTSFRNFTWSSMAGGDAIMVETYREQRIKSDVHQISAYDDLKLTGASLTRQLTGL